MFAMMKMNWIPKKWKRIVKEAEVRETTAVCIQEDVEVIKKNNGAPCCPCYKSPFMSTHPIIVETLLQSTLQQHGYKDGKILGKGQFGVVRKLTARTGQLLACKSMAKDVAITTPGDIADVKREIDFMARLSDHPNVVQLKAVYEDDRYIHLVMELCSGGDLSKRIAKQRHFSECDAAQVFRQLMQTVAYLHDHGIIHRDLKPENIMITSSAPNCLYIKVADFGISTFYHPGQRHCEFVGTPQYMAPEVITGAHSEKADIWSCGVILYFMLSGKLPFNGRCQAQVLQSVTQNQLPFTSHTWDHISDAAKHLIRSMICRDVERRRTAKEVLMHSWFTSTH